MADTWERVQYAVRGKSPTAKGWIRCNCPMCEFKLASPDRKRSFGYNVATRRYECYRCGSAGRLPEWRDEWADFVPPPALAYDAPRDIMPTPDGFYPLAGEVAAGSVSLAAAVEYVLGRGLPMSLVEEAGIGACVTGRMSGRVVVPLLNEQREWLWYVGRVWRKKAPMAYLYPTGDRRGLMYNYQALHVRTDEPVLVVEGAFDALACWPDAVAVLGKPTPENVDGLAAARRPVVVVLDGDAHDEAWALAAQLRLEGQDAGSVRLPPRVDPDEVPRDVLRLAAQAALRDGEAVL